MLKLKINGRNVTITKSEDKHDQLAAIEQLMDQLAGMRSKIKPDTYEVVDGNVPAYVRAAGGTHSSSWRVHCIKTFRNITSGYLRDGLRFWEAATTVWGLNDQVLFRMVLIANEQQRKFGKLLPEVALETAQELNRYGR